MEISALKAEAHLSLICDMLALTLFLCSQGTGLVELEEAILTQAELSSLKADYTGRVEGVILEVKSDRGLG